MTHRVIEVRIIGVFETIFVHDPISLLAVRSSTTVEHEGFAHPDLLVRVSNALVSACGLPETGIGGSIGS